MKVTLKFDDVSCDCDDRISDVLIQLVDAVLSYDHDGDYCKDCRRLLKRELCHIVDDFFDKRLSY